MELRHLRSFVALADELNFTRAALKLNVTTPSLSERIQFLEAELGVRLVRRTTRSVTLTEAGRRFLQDAREVVLRADRAADIARHAGRGEVGRITIGYVTSVACSDVLSGTLAAFMQHRPRVEIELLRFEAARQLQLLAAEELDIGFLRPPRRYPTGISGIVLRHQSTVLALPQGHRLARLQQVPAALLANESFIAPSVEIELGSYGQMGAIGQQGGFQPKVARRAQDFITVLTLVAARYGIAAVPDTFRCMRLPGVVYRPLSEPVEPSVFAAAFRSSEQVPATRALIQFLRSSAGNTGRSGA